MLAPQFNIECWAWTWQHSMDSSVIACEMRRFGFQKCYAAGTFMFSFFGRCNFGAHPTHFARLLEICVLAIYRWSNVLLLSGKALSIPPEERCQQRASDGLQVLRAHLITSKIVPLIITPELKIWAASIPESGTWLLTLLSLPWIFVWTTLWSLISIAVSI